MNKIALICGNDNYPESPLKNAVNDVKAIGDRLKSLGFQCIICANAGKKEMYQGLRDFAKKLENNDVALFFFAGHGMQIDGANYLTAIDTDFQDEGSAKYSSLPLNQVIETMEDGHNQTSIIILDACRNNPYERRWRGGAETRGLAPVYAPKGMIIAYATSPGQVASDGPGENGAFTTAVLRHITTQDISIEELFKRVRNTLSTFTKGRQISWEHTSLMGDFSFNFAIASDDLIAEYSAEAFADESFRLSDEHLHPIIKSLKSHTWDIQNLAIFELKKTDLNEAEKDSLFVLGRNIYQAACGDAHSAIHFLDNLDANLSKMGGKVVFHILNGMLYEIYFNKKGRKRETGKVEMIDRIMALEDKAVYVSSFNFIQQALKPYLKELFYIPGKGKDICVDITTHKMPDNRRAISGLFYEGDNILYDEKGEAYFDPLKDDYLTLASRAEISTILLQSFIAPSYRLKLNYVDFDNPIVSLLIPSFPKIRRFSK